MGAAAARPEVVAALARALQEDRFAGPRIEAAGALGLMGRQAAVPEVVSVLARAVQGDEDWRVRAAAARALGAMGAKAVLREALRELEARMARAVLAGREPDGRDRAAWCAAREALGSEKGEAP